MTVEDSDDVFVAGAMAPGMLSPADLIADFTPGAEIVDLTGLIDSLLGSQADQTVAPAIPVVAAAPIEPAQFVPAAGEASIELAALSGIGHTITILFDDTLNTGT